MKQLKDIWKKMNYKALFITILVWVGFAGWFYVVWNYPLIAAYFLGSVMFVGVITVISILIYQMSIYCFGRKK